MNGPQFIFFACIFYVSFLIAKTLQEPLGLNRWIIFVPILVLLVGALRLMTTVRVSQRDSQSDEPDKPL